MCQQETRKYSDVLSVIRMEWLIHQEMANVLIELNVYSFKKILKKGQTNSWNGMGAEARGP